jgi:hypothetical protein
MYLPRVDFIGAGTVPLNQRPHSGIAGVTVVTDANEERHASATFGGYASGKNASQYAVAFSRAELQCCRLMTLAQ